MLLQNSSRIWVCHDPRAFIRKFCSQLPTFTLRKQEQKQREVVKIVEDELSFWAQGFHNLTHFRPSSKELFGGILPYADCQTMPQLTARS